VGSDSPVVEELAMDRSAKLFLWLLLLLVALLTAGSPASVARIAPVDEPRYDEKGQLKRPEKHETWVFVGASIGLRYRPAGKDAPGNEGRRKEARPAEFHNVYIRPESYAEYVKTGKFPDRTVLVMDVYEAKEKDEKGVVSGGLFPGKQLRIEVAVKDSKRPDGSRTPWAYYAFPPKKESARAFADRDCYDCHRKHADRDNVWVQFYPVLRLPGPRK
jgi:hypothetical protein